MDLSKRRNKIKRERAVVLWYISRRKLYELSCDSELDMKYTIRARMHLKYTVKPHILCIVTYTSYG